jgi:hypothetical protein
MGHRVAVAALVDWLCAGDVLPAGALDCTGRTSGDGPDAMLARLLGSAQN